MALADTAKQAFDLAKLGPEPFERLLTKVEAVYGTVEPLSFDDVLSAVKAEGEGGTVRGVLRQVLAKWDYEDEPEWGEGSVRGTAGRREVIYRRLGLSPSAAELLSDRIPFFAVEPPVVIKADTWSPWYDQERRVGHTFYWDAFSRHLGTTLGWPAESVLSLDESTDAVVARLADPLSARAYPSRGLVVGYVQSGKTANITGVIAKAADAGYRLIIVLAGTLNLLRDQTQRRLDRELIGAELLESEYADDGDAATILSHGARPSELGSFDWIRLTGRRREYQKLSGGAIESLRFTRLDAAKPLNHPDNLYRLPARLLVVKKQANVLDRLAGDLARVNRNGELGEIPAIVIDDESDQASVNTARPPSHSEGDDDVRERRRINQAIVDLLGALPRAQYIGYTATPFANVFVDPADAEDVFPRDFIVSLPRPVGYLGARDFHDLDGPPVGSDKQPYRSNERAFVRPIIGDDEDALNLQRAIDSFVISGAIKLYRQRQTGALQFRHHTLMIHTSARTADHQTQLERVRDLLLRGGYRTGAARGRLQTLFDEDFLPVSRVRRPELPMPESMANLEEEIGEVLTRLYRGGNPVLQVNSTSEADQLEFDTNTVWKIVVGGAKLSRGFTVEGLTTSYFRRKSPTADTLMQMGRWCGFRRGYDDLVRLFIGRREPQGRDSLDVYEAFEAICRDEEDFRAELAQYALPATGEAPITPMDIPPLVGSRLEWIRPTSRDKMFNARITFRNFSGVSVEHRRVAQTAADQRHNVEALRRLLDSGSFEGQELAVDAASARAFGGVRAAAAVRDFLGAYRFADRAPDLVHELAFLDGEYGDPEINDWAVLLPQLKMPTSPSWEYGGQSLSVHHRGYWQETPPLANAFTGPVDKAVVTAIALPKQESDVSADLERLRTPGRAVLLVYPVRHAPVSNPEAWTPTVGLTLQFPTNRIPRKIGFSAQVPRLASLPVVDVSSSEEA